jgi:hypothetical protein
MQLVHQAIVPHIIERFFDVQESHYCRLRHRLVLSNEFGNSIELMDGGPSLTEPKLFLREDTILIHEEKQTVMDCLFKQLGEGRE